MKFYLVILCTLCFLFGFVWAEDPQIEAVRGLIKRLLPNHVGYFELHLLEKQSTDRFELETRGNKLVIRGTSGVALASGLYWYLKNFGNSSLTWYDRHISIPNPPPKIPGRVSVTSPYKWRYYYNTCTYGYTTAFWNWSRWEQEIDWMALHGINFPLAFEGQELVWQDTYLKLGLNLTELSNFFTGPAFLPWNRMGNVDGWAGPLPQIWIRRKSELQKQILTRMRQLGMIPILPGFAGHVPAALKAHYPRADIVQLAPWADFNGTYFLNPNDTLFSEIQMIFLRRQMELYGTNHYYNVDPFNELTPPSNDPTYLASISSKIFESLRHGDNQSIWVLQGWFLQDQGFWHPAQTQAFLSAVPKGRLIILDLWAEQFPVWWRTDGFYGHDFIWCMLHNFGGRSGLYGSLPVIATQPLVVNANKSVNMVGIGLTPEGTMNNPVVYELMTDMAWINHSFDLEHWLQKFIICRYGHLVDSVSQAWTLLLRSVYNNTNHQFGPTACVFVYRPSLSMAKSDTIRPYYDMRTVQTAWTLFLNASSILSKVETFRNDLVEITRQSLQDVAFLFYLRLMNAYNISKNSTELNQIAIQMMSLLHDMDNVLMTQKPFLLGPWLEAAKNWGSTSDEKKLYEFNARMQITLWSPPTDRSLHDYAWKLWSGLVADYYGPRWQLFLRELNTSLITKTSFNETQYISDCVAIDYRWNLQQNDYPIMPRHDIVTLAHQMFAKYGHYFRNENFLP